MLCARVCARTYVGITRLVQECSSAALSKASTPTKDGEKATKSPSKAEEEKVAKAEV